MFLFRSFLICCFFLIPLQTWAESCATAFLGFHIDLRLSLNTSKILYTAGVRSMEGLRSKTEEELRELFNSNDQALQEIKVVLSREEDQGLFSLTQLRTLNEMGVYTVESLNLPAEFVKVLYTAGVRSVEDLRSKTEKELSELFNSNDQALQEINAAIRKKLASTSVSDLDLSESTTDMLDVLRIYSTEDLIKRTERELLMLLSHAGPHNHSSLVSDPNLVLREIKSALERRELRLSDDFLVNDIGLSVRVANALNAVAGVHTMEDLAGKTERELKRLLKPYVSTTAVHSTTRGIILRIKTALSERGLSLKPDPLVKDLGLSDIAANALNRAGIHTIEDLTGKRERELRRLLKPYLSTTTIYSTTRGIIPRIKTALSERGLSLTSHPAERGLSFARDPLVEDLVLSIWVVDTLNRAGIHTIEDLTSKTEIEISKLGIRSQAVELTREALAKWGLSFRNSLIEDLGLSVRMVSTLNRVGIHTIEGLTSKTERDLLGSGISNRAIDQVRKALAKWGLSFRNPLVEDLGLSVWAANVLNRAGIHTIEDLTRKTGTQLLSYPRIANIIAKRNVFDLGFSSQTVQALNRAGIHTIEDLVKKTIIELSEFDGIGSESLGEIKKMFSEMGLDSST